MFTCWASGGSTLWNTPITRLPNYVKASGIKQKIETFEKKGEPVGFNFHTSWSMLVTKFISSDSTALHKSGSIGNAVYDMRRDCCAVTR